MSRQSRLEALEASFPPSHDGDTCLACAGPGGYRGMVDRALAGSDGALEERCRRCGGLTYYGGIVAERARLGPESVTRTITVPGRGTA